MAGHLAIGNERRNLVGSSSQAFEPAHGVNTISNDSFDILMDIKERKMHSQRDVQ